MQPRSARRLLFALAVLTLPLPVLGPWPGLVPAARHLILFTATAAVALAEGAAGPVPGILLLFALHALAGVALCGALAWGAVRLSSALSPRARRVWVLGVCALALAAALAFDAYRTPFGRTPRANLIGVLS